MRKYLIPLVSLAWLVLFCACSEEAKVKEAAVNGAKDQFQTEMKAEIAKAVKGKLRLQATAAQTLTEKSDFNVQKVEINGKQAQVFIEVSTVPLKARTALIEIIARLEEKQEAHFSVGDALRLIVQQMELGEKRNLLFYHISLEKTHGWQVLKKK